MYIGILWFMLTYWATTQALEYKNLAGPATHFDYHRIPDPSQVPHISRSMSKSIWFGDLNVTTHDNEYKIEATNPIYSASLPIDGTKGVILAFASPAHETLRVELVDPEGNKVQGNAGSDFYHISDTVTVPAATFVVDKPVLGTYIFRIYSKGLTVGTYRELKSNPYADAVLTLLVDNDVRIASHLLSYEMKVGAKIGLVSTIVIGNDHYADVPDNDVIVSQANMMVTNPYGAVETVVMNDDGVDGDEVAQDGKYTGQVTAHHSGTYLIEARLNGNVGDPNGLITETPFQRTTQHFVQVSDILSLAIGDKAILKTVDAKRYALNISVTGDEASKKQLRAYTEVNAVKPDNTIVPVCWLGGLVKVDEKTHTYQLMFDKRWLADAGVTVNDRLFIQNTYLSDVTTSFPIASVHTPINVQLESSALPLFAELRNLRKFGERSAEELREMKRGVRPSSTIRNHTDAGEVPNLVLLPGYCADVNPWSRRGSKDFTNGFYPVKYGNFPNDEYAHYIMDQINAANLTKFGIIAHSQGGMVALHIHNYYWTGLEDATGGRVIQTLGTPYQGTSASGSMANLAKVFGIACGTNTDLSRDGAANWLSGIALDSRQDVYSYGSTYGGGDHYFDYCSLPMNLIIEWPNDGVTEKDYAQLPGGNWEGFVNMWCHTVDMTYPPQYDDDSRNAILNKNAAR